MLFGKSPTFQENDLPSVIQACISQNPQAQRLLIKQFYGYAMKICLPYATNKMEAEEIINDGFLKVFLNLHKYDSINPFKAWLRTLMVNTAIDYYRKNQKYANNIDIAGMEIGDIEVDIFSKISAEEILELVQKLTPAYRITFTMYVIEGYNHREISERLNIKEGTSKSNLSDARTKLQEMIRVNYPHLFDIYSNGGRTTKNNKWNED